MGGISCNDKSGAGSKIRKEDLLPKKERGMLGECTTMTKRVFLPVILGLRHGLDGSMLDF
jgi:hypothetical protein